MPPLIFRVLDIGEQVGSPIEIVLASCGIDGLGRRRSALPDRLVLRPVRRFSVRTSKCVRGRPHAPGCRRCLPCHSRSQARDGGTCHVPEWTYTAERLALGSSRTVLSPPMIYPYQCDDLAWIRSSESSSCLTKLAGPSISRPRCWHCLALIGDGIQFASPGRCGNPSLAGSSYLLDRG